MKYFRRLSRSHNLTLPPGPPKVTYVPEALCEKESSIFAHYESGINFDKYDDILVDVSGSNPPKAIMVSALLVAVFLVLMGYFINLLTFTTEWTSTILVALLERTRKRLRCWDGPRVALAT